MSKNKELNESRNYPDYRNTKAQNPYGSYDGKREPRRKKSDIYIRNARAHKYMSIDAQPHETCVYS